MAQPKAKPSKGCIGRAEDGTMARLTSGARGRCDIRTAATVQRQRNNTTTDASQPHSQKRSTSDTKGPHKPPRCFQTTSTYPTRLHAACPLRAGDGAANAAGRRTNGHGQQYHRISASPLPQRLDSEARPPHRAAQCQVHNATLRNGSRAHAGKRRHRIPSSVPQHPKPQGHASQPGRKPKCQSMGEQETIYARRLQSHK